MSSLWVLLHRSSISSPSLCLFRGNPLKIVFLFKAYFEQFSVMLYFCYEIFQNVYYLAWPFNSFCFGIQHFTWYIFFLFLKKIVIIEIYTLFEWSCICFISFVKHVAHILSNIASMSLALSLPHVIPFKPEWFAIYYCLVTSSV